MIRDTTVVARRDLEETGVGEYGKYYQCPRCEFDSVSEYCDCPKCGWAGMCQEDFS